MEPQTLKLLRRKLEHEVLREAGKVPAHCPIEGFCFNTIKLGQVRIEHDLLSADQQNPALHAFGGDRQI